MLEGIGLECLRGDRQLFTALDFELSPGELLRVHGPNGTGKTSLLRLVSGLLPITDGDILWNGNSISEDREAYNDSLTFIGHLGGIKEEISPVENLQISTKLSGKEVHTEELYDVLARMGLEEVEDLPSKALSQGQKRRVALARLLIKPTPLWVLDEPYTALDHKAAHMIRNITDEHLENGGMVIMTTHQEVPSEAIKTRHIRLGEGQQ